MYQSYLSFVAQTQVGNQKNGIRTVRNTTVRDKAMFCNQSDKIWAQYVSIFQK